MLKEETKLNTYITHIYHSSYIHYTAYITMICFEKEKKTSVSIISWCNTCAFELTKHTSHSI